MTGAFYFQGVTDMPGCTSRLLPEGPFATKWHLNRSQSGRLLPDPDGGYWVISFHKNTQLASEGLLRQ
ncbi:septum formation initiator [Escherichia coli]|nr:septum formation initiator [Escherichia coli]